MSFYHYLLALEQVSELGAWRLALEKKKKKAMSSPSCSSFLATQRRMFTWVLHGSGSSRSTLQAHSNLQAPSSLPLNVSGARSSGDGMRGEGLVGGR